MDFGIRTMASTAVIGALVVTGSAVAHADGVTLTLWHNTSDTPAVLSLYAAYEKASGNKISLVDIPADGFETAVLTKWASGDRPDILEYHPVLATLDQLNPPQNLVDLSGEEFVNNSDIYEIGGRASDGKVYAAITTFPETWGIYYNKKVLADHGLKPATTFEEMKAQCAVLSKDGITTLHEAGASAWPVAVQVLIYASVVAEPGWVADVMTHKAKLSDPDSPIAQGLHSWLELKNAGCYNADMTTATFEQSAHAVFTGKAAYQLIHSNIAPVYFDEANGDAKTLDAAVGFQGIGAKVQKTTVSPGPIGTYMLPKTGDATRQAAALDFIHLITGPGYADYIAQSGTFPIIKGAQNPANTSGLLNDIKAAYDKGPRVPLINGSLPGGLLNGIQVMGEVSVGQLAPDAAAEQYQQGVEAAAQAQGLPGW
jgi:raffinose/stachyose/melibiose transport system substrate-binding protein